MAGKTFQFVECACIFKGFGIKFDRGKRGVAAGATTGGFFFVFGVRSRIGSQKEFRAATGSGFDQRLLVGAAFQNRQTVIMRANTTGEHVVAIVEQVMCGDGRRNIGGGGGNKFRSIGGGNVLQHHLQRRKVAHYLAKSAIQKYFFAIKNINRTVGHFAVQ